MRTIRSNQFTGTGKVCAQCGDEILSADDERKVTEWLGRLFEKDKDLFRLHVSLTAEADAGLDRLVVDYPWLPHVAAIRGLLVLYFFRVQTSEALSKQIRDVAGRRTYAALFSGDKKVYQLRLPPRLLMELTRLADQHHISEPKMLEIVVGEVLALFASGEAPKSLHVDLALVLGSA